MADDERSPIRKSTGPAGPAGPAGPVGRPGEPVPTTGVPGTRGAQGVSVGEARDNENEDSDALDTLKWEVAEQLGLDDDLQNPDELTVREAGKVGGQMVKRLIDKGKEAIAEEDQGSRGTPGTPGTQGAQGTRQ